MDFDPFESLLETFQQCRNNYGHVSAEQISQIGASSMSALGISFTKNAGAGLIVRGTSVFPVSFEIGPDNAMVPNLRFEGEIQISARLDSDGNAFTKLPGDLSGAARSSHAPGASGVDILLDTRL